MPVMTYREAVRLAIMEELDRDPNVFVMGEDIGKYKGTFRVTDGLYEKYGIEQGDWIAPPTADRRDGIARRIIDTPITEPAIVGMATGAAMAGLRPIVEMMTMSFSILALDQIINHAAKIHYMTGGKATVPLVVRLEGTNVELGKKILNESGLAITAADDLDDAAKKIVAAING